MSSGRSFGMTTEEMQKAVKRGISRKGTEKRIKKINKRKMQLNSESELERLLRQ